MQHSLPAKALQSLRRLHDIPVGEVVCGGIVCTAPALLAAYLHNPLFSWSAIAAFWTYLSLVTGGFWTRLSLALSFGVAGALASGLGAWTVAYPPVVIVLAAITGFGGAVAQGGGTRIGLPALLAATAFAVSTAFPGKDFAHGMTYATYFLYGNLWATGFALLLWRIEKPHATSITEAAQASFTLTSDLTLHGLRVGLAAAISVGLVQYWRLDHGYWMTLTVFFIMQPKFSGTLKTSLERVAGTLLGSLLAAALGSFIHSPLLLAALILPLSIGTLAGRSISYRAYILFLTPHFILVAELGQPSASELGLSILRVCNSLGGALLAVGISLLVYPWCGRR
ncbi:FUSC family protein [Pseudomonas sp. MH9.2]|uniref:FUSC family protein n=1 Tax=unclassified Pseudomonas TaxID=196821 RepID=UPI002AC92CB9|nr:MULTISPECIES: FUSC family protein [unclassified Pseudomonas]MEB0009157.1 FUSC family protein [Pseudomonas sp. RTB2]MEB0018269.1 FUSC family protein [Pseudomonas sp. RTB3]MEB0025299.1 FUSC family protein [Pseudomonas sp. MH9.2]MEB0147148.1 FUSC family protein [Pseudomonas sp. CCC2.2]MEB0268490.1 FUSC family protein [Pseudomonas sp. 5B4]